MIKRIFLISLFLCMPIFVQADAYYGNQPTQDSIAITIGRDTHEKNIPFDIDVMESVLWKAFDYDEELKAAFYGELYDSLSMPFSMQELHSLCRSAVSYCFNEKSYLANCADLVRLYVNSIVKSGGNVDDFRDAIHKHDIVAIKEYIANGGDVNVPLYEDGHNALMISIRDNHQDMVEILLDAGAFVDATTDGGKTALYISVAEKNVPITQLLLKHGANPDLFINKFYPSVLFLTADSGNFEIVKLLLEYGADRNIRDADGRTPCDVFWFNNTNGYLEDKRIADLLCPDVGGNVMDNSENAGISPCDKVNDWAAKSCCIAEEDGVAEWNAYTRSCRCLDNSKKWDDKIGYCVAIKELTCAEKYSGYGNSVVACCELSKQEITFFNPDNPYACFCRDENKIWNKDKLMCEDDNARFMIGNWQEYEGRKSTSPTSKDDERRKINEKYAEDMRQPWQEYEVHEAISSTSKR